ncbi:MAG: hypothetical protein HC842_01255 [Cytophagales bacterium]|nr:hypothetical protein [Cytophagales bacterium]
MQKLLLALLILSALAACNENNNPDEGQNFVFNDSSATSGRLIVETLDQSGNRLDNTVVYLFLAYEDIERNLYIFFRESDNNGKADFGYINIGSYYITSIKANLGLSDTAVVQVRSQQIENKRVVLN